MHLRTYWACLRDFAEKCTAGVIEAFWPPAGPYRVYQASYNYFKAYQSLSRKLRQSVRESEKIMRPNTTAAACVFRPVLEL